MDIWVQRTGGYAGFTETLADLSTDRLDPAAAREVEAVVRNTDLFNLPTEVGNPGDTIFQYVITADNGKRQHRVTFNDGGAPECAPLRKLVETLTAMSRR